MSGFVRAAPPESQAVFELPALADRPADAPAPLRLARAAAAPAPILGETLFRDALLRERRRADRFEDAFALALVSFDRRHAPPSSWQQVHEALAHPDLDADLVGWFEHGSAVGVIRSLDDHDPANPSEGEAASFRGRLLSCLGPELGDQCSVRLEVYSPSSEATPSVVFDAPGARLTSRDRVRDGAKRALDVAGSAALMALLSPVFLIVAGLVKYSSKGPVFFSQYRVGTGGRLFRMHKFRTMQANADPAIHQQYVESFIKSQEKTEPGSNVVRKIVNDPRVTPIGSFLRKSSLDELPQFWNVLKGEMSLVGPRPPLPYEVAKYKSWHRRRVLEAKPGVTGLWQVTGRSRTTFDEMVRLDLRYARSSSVWIDLKILLATPRTVLSRKGAH